MASLFPLFISLKFFVFILNEGLSFLNRRYFENLANQKIAKETLAIDNASFSKTLAYTQDRSRISTISECLDFSAFLLFLCLGGFGILEEQASTLAITYGIGEIGTSLLFFLFLGGLNLLWGLPFSYYSTFVIEAKHGFNHQTPKGFFMDQLKAIMIGCLLGGALISLVLYCMSLGSYWWIWAWAVMSLFGLFASWIYPTVLAPLFNRFTPLEEGALKNKIQELAKKIEFKTDGVYIMDASTRSSHGNAYFTGVFGKKRIVLFDTLVKNLNEDEIVAVLAHELGHFKLNHVRWGIIRSTISSALLFFAMSLCIENPIFYEALGFQHVGNYQALVVFSLWFGLVSFFLGPISSWISRRNEFAADHFAHSFKFGALLVTALKKLRESNHSMPLAHPLYSGVHFSHPPIMERIKAIEALR